MEESERLSTRVRVGVSVIARLRVHATNQVVWKCECECEVKGCVRLGAGVSGNVSVK